MKLVDFPQYKSPHQYELAIAAMINRLKDLRGVRSIFQVGGISSPGISDIDILVVFEDGQSCLENPLYNLRKEYRYLYMHSLFGLNDTLFKQAQRFAFFHNFNHLWGRESELTNTDLSIEEFQTTNRQAGLEYMIKMFITMSIEKSYRIIKVRNMLLHAKAILLDLEYFNISSGKIVRLLQQILDWRAEWFTLRPSTKMLLEWHSDFYSGLVETIDNLLKIQPFHLPLWANYQMAKNVFLVPSSTLSYKKTGITFPECLGGIGRKYFNFQHRFNRFTFFLPIEQEKIPDCLLLRHKFLEKLCQSNAVNYPYFLPVAYGLPIFRRKEGLPKNGM